MVINPLWFIMIMAAYLMRPGYWRRQRRARRLNRTARATRRRQAFAARWSRSWPGRCLYHGRHRSQAWRLSASEWESVRVAAGGW